MENSERIRRFIRLAKVRAIRFTGLTLFLRALALGAVFLFFSILMDAAFGLPAAARDALRWSALLGAAAFISSGFWIKRFDLRLNRILERIQRHFESIDRHDPLLNAWSFIGESRRSPEDEEEIQNELVAKEVERGAAFAKTVKKRLNELYGIRAALRQAGKRWMTAFVFAPAAIAGTGALLGPDTATLLRRFADPYREISRILERIELEPAPGLYKPLRGTSQTVRVRMKGQKPPGWGNPKILLDGEEQAMGFSMDADEAVYFYTAASVVRPLRLQLRWGEFLSEPWIFEPVTLPEPVEISVMVHAPEYARQQPKSLTNPTRITLMQGGRLEIQGRASAALRQAGAFWQAPERPESLAALGAVSGDKFSFTASPSTTLRAGPHDSVTLRLRLALTDEDGRINETAWIVDVESLPDMPASVSILDPMFTEVVMDVNEELPIAWEASDDVKLLSVAAVLALQANPNLGQRRGLWKAPGEASSAHGVHLFKPSRWGLRAGDKAVFYLEAQDFYPTERAPGVSREKLSISITDFSAQHKENLEKAGEDLKEALMSHLEKGLDLAGALESKEAGASQIQQYDRQAQELIQKLREQAKKLEQDPLASPKWSWGMKKLAENLDNARSSNLSKGSQEGLDRYLQELEKSASAFNELKKEQKMTDAVGSAQRLENLTKRLESRLDDAQSVEELMEVLSDLDREFQELAKALQNMSPEEFPQEFVNQMDPEDLPVGEVSDAKSELADALKSGDMKKAKEAAKKMLENIRKMRKNLEEASENYRKKPQDLLGSPGGGAEQGKDEESISKDIDSIKKSQEELLWRTSAVDQEARKRRASERERGREGEGVKEESLTEEEKASLKKQSEKQKEILGKSRKTLEEMAKLDRGYPSLMLGSLTQKMEMASKAQEEAEKKLGALDLQGALAAENEALKRLEELQQGLDQMSQELAKMPGGGQGEGGGRPLMMIPGGMNRGSGGERGAHLGPVRIPKPEDYKVPAQKRQEILKSLQERAPKSMEQEVGEYLKSLLK